MADEMYMDNLDEYINDENKLVTYKWLSCTLCVHVNVAKQMLYAFVQQQRAKKQDISVTYLVAGLHNNSDLACQRVEVVPEERLAASKARLERVTSCHVYSVQKAQITDLNALHMADFESRQENLFEATKYSAVQCAAARPRSGQELEKLRNVAQPTSAAPSFAKSAPKAGPAKKKADIGAMLAGQKKSPQKKEKPAAPEKTEKTEEKTKEEKPAAKPKQGAMASFFAKQAAKPKTHKPKVEPEVKKEEAAETEKKTSPVKTAPQKEIAAPPKKKSPVSRKDTSKSRRKNSDKGDGGGDKKRRRIQNKVWSDSSEDDEQEEEEAMEVVIDDPPTPPREPTPPPAEEDEPEQQPAETRSPGGKRRKRVKKHVSKTYMNDEGFMVTEKVMESASETDRSDAEDNPPAKPQTAKSQPAKVQKPAEKKKSPAKANKQANIMNFFKKK